MRLSNNISLPMLPAIAARSTWAIVFAAAITIFNALGIDLLGFFQSIGAGATPDEVIATGHKVVSAWQIVAPLGFGIWAWLERRAPNFRLTFWKPKADNGLGIGAAFLALVLIGGSATELRAQNNSASCFEPTQIKQMLAERYSEELWSGGSGPVRDDLCQSEYRQLDICGAHRRQSLRLIGGSRLDACSARATARTSLTKKKTIKPEAK